MSGAPSVLITGAAGGIGSALCEAFRGAGYRVLALDRVPLSAPHDVALDADLERLCGDGAYRAQVLARVRQALPDDRLQALVNNAAVQALHPTEQVTPEEWQRTLAVNLTAPFLLVQGLLQPLERARGAVVNIGSVHAIATKPSFVAYATSKAALDGLTRALAVDLGARVRVNALQVAATATPMLLAGFAGKPRQFEQLAGMHPLQRIAEPREVAQAALFLASPAAGFMTGGVLPIHGGILARLHDPD